jgi:hypothetical protein
MIVKGIRHNGKCHHCKEVIHVVETSALDTMREKLSRAEGEIQRMNAEVERSMNVDYWGEKFKDQAKELTAERVRCEKLVEALTQIAGEHPSFTCDDHTDCEWVAKAALEKHTAHKEGRE